MMMKILIAPGAYKHSLTPHQASLAIHDGLTRSGLLMDTVSIPIADGGNGTLDVLLAASANSERITLTVRNPLGQPVKASYGLLNDGKVAVIEMAQASGIELLPSSERNPLKASSYGTGQLMLDALNRGANQFIIGLGGSATVDAGLGCLQALGWVAFDQHGRKLVQQGGGVLSRVASLDRSGVDSRWVDCEITLIVDVENLPYGENGAARVFGKQKGATPEQIDTLDQGVQSFLQILSTTTQQDVTALVGGGAAGAMSAGLVGAFNAKIVRGIDYILDFLNFEAHLAECQLLITGEGHMDSQTLEGKGPLGVAQRAKASGLVTVALVGGVSVDDSILREAGLDVILPIVNQPMELNDAIQNAYGLLERTALRLGYLLQWMPSLGDVRKL